MLDVLPSLPSLVGYSITGGFLIAAIALTIRLVRYSRRLHRAGSACREWVDLNTCDDTGDLLESAMALQVHPASSIIRAEIEQRRHLDDASRETTALQSFDSYFDSIKCVTSYVQTMGPRVGLFFTVFGFGQALFIFSQTHSTTDMMEAIGLAIWTTVIANLAGIIAYTATSYILPACERRVLATTTEILKLWDSRIEFVPRDTTAEVPKQAHEVVIEEIDEEDAEEAVRAAIETARARRAGARCCSGRSTFEPQPTNEQEVSHAFAD